MSIIDEINANTQAIISGKSLVTNAIIEKGGTVEQVGELPTFYELAEGIESIEAGGGSAGKGLACLPIKNLKIVQVSKDLAKITWDNPVDPNRAGIQVRTAVGYIPSLPESTSDVIQEYTADINELDLYLENVSVGDVVGVWILPVNLVGEVQTLRNTGNAKSIKKLATIDSVQEFDVSANMGDTSSVSDYGMVINDYGDIVVVANERYGATARGSIPMFLDRETGVFVQCSNSTDVVYVSNTLGSTDTTILTKRAQIVDPVTQDIYLVGQDSYYSYLYKFYRETKELKKLSTAYITNKGKYNLYLGADSCIYMPLTLGGLTAIKAGTDEEVPITNFSNVSGLTTMFNHGGKTYVMNVNKALGTIEDGVYTPINIGTVSQATIENDNLLYAYDDGTLILGAYDNHDGAEPIKYYLNSYGITVVNINTGEINLLRSSLKTNYCDSFSRAIPLPSGNLLLLGSRGRTNPSSSSYFRTSVAIYNKELNTVEGLLARCL